MSQSTADVEFSVNLKFSRVLRSVQLFLKWDLLVGFQTEYSIDHVNAILLVKYFSP